MPKASELKVLLVDDQESMRSLGRYALNQIGVTDVIFAKSGREALKVLSSNKVSLVISDWNMEDVDGLKLLQVVRQHPVTKSLPFVMATGNSDKAQVSAAVQAGVNNYIVKPYDVATLRKKLEAVVGAIV